MDEGRILSQGTYKEMEQVKEFKEIMEINDLNKNLEDKSDYNASDADTVEEVSEDENGDNSEERQKEIHEMIRKASSKRGVSMKRKSSKKPGLAGLMEGEESSEVEEADNGNKKEEE
jgi:hypothetical protein